MATMIVKDLRLSLQEYGADKGKLSGAVKFSGPIGEVSIRIDPEKAAKVLVILAKEWSTRPRMWRS